MSAYLIGHMTVRDTALWDEYRARVPDTLGPFGGEVLFRGRRRAVLAGEHDHPDAVVIRFPDAAALDAWFASEAYQALIPVRERAADMVLVSYDA
ncbi:hypothetical protein B1C78_12015 [Thioalkalivibrio denitrificans]|uniref:DUF1330 domain-containing protein n=1 Tax=Thioalkalivibrio denitrificans TaxID=108003 RepID=A0A1V3NE86_9GAMM|nr:DUF1330 domain-containing protein [Thioalkalivibrio denitrificans]OOG23198.1 hypothetical protein B1C78_12015 [Thioalkalivibrio denitrificans]